MIETLIIVRTKNEDRWIKPTLKSLENQTYQNFKILVVDNCSKDRTCDILRERNIEFLKIKKFLPGKAINMAINHFKKTKCTIATVDYKTLYIFSDKIRTYKSLKEKNLPFPEFDIIKNYKEIKKKIKEFMF